jgi:hypothetical protein
MEIKELYSMVKESLTDDSSRVQLVKHLEQGSLFLETQREDITSLWNGTSPSKVDIFSFYETKKTATVKKVSIQAMKLHI